MSRAPLFSLYLIIFTSIWLSLLYNIIPLTTLSHYLPFISYKHLSIIQHHIIPLLPIYLLISFDCYSLSVIGYSLLTFNECPDAFKELEQDISNAKKRLINKGFKFT